MPEVMQNRLLAALPERDREDLTPELKSVELRSGQVLLEPGGVPTSVWFPTTAVCSTVTTMSGGGSIETDLVGNEGVVGSWIALGALRSPWTSLIQLPGDALELPASTFRQQLAASSALRTLVLRYALTEHYLTAQSVGCNRFHDLPERAARWLLTLQDRTDLTELAITQEFLSQMLGVQRPSVTLALGTLERAGLLEQAGRGRLRIVDRVALESAACECYARVRDFGGLQTEE